MNSQRYELADFNEDLAWLHTQISNNYIKRGNFTLSSGEQSEYYVDVKSAYTDLEFIQRANKLLYFELSRGFIVDQRKPAQSIGGLEAGAIPILTSLAIEYQIPYFWIRKAQKEYGLKDMQIIGQVTKPVVIVEDVLNSGAGINKVANVVGVTNVMGVICVVNRYRFGDRINLTDGKTFESKVIDVRALFELKDFVDV